MASIIWAVYAAILIYAAIHDARTYRIPNWTSIALIVVFAGAVTLSWPGWETVWPHLAVGGGALVFGYLLFQFTNMGAGDAKLGAAIALWAGTTGGFAYLVGLSFAMAGLAIVLIIIRRIYIMTKADPPTIRAFQKDAPVPLGIAISLGGLFASRHYADYVWPF